MIISWTPYSFTGVHSCFPLSDVYYVGCAKIRVLRTVRRSG